MTPGYGEGRIPAVMMEWTCPPHHTSQGVMFFPLPLPSFYPPVRDGIRRIGSQGMVEHGYQEID